MTRYEGLDGGDMVNYNREGRDLTRTEATEEAAAWILFWKLWPGLPWENHPHLAETPRRFVKMMLELTTPIDINWKDFASDSDEMVVVHGITFTSLCAHHVVPYMGVAHIAYVPDGRICGLSKLARVVRHHSAGLTVQEELTSTVASELASRLNPAGVAVVMEAEHLCMSIRGVQAPGTKTITSCMQGVFADHQRQARSEFLSLIGKK